MLVWTWTWRNQPVEVSTIYDHKSNKSTSAASHNSNFHNQNKVITEVVIGCPSYTQK